MVQKSGDKNLRLDRGGLLEILRGHLPDLRERYGVRSLAVFGSYARGEARMDSDLDLLVEFDRVPGLIGFIEIEQHLSDLLGVKVDLVMKDSLKPGIGRQIQKDLVPV